MKRNTRSMKAFNILKGLYITLLYCIFIIALPISLQASVVITDAAGRQVALETIPGRIVVVGTAPFIPLHMMYMFEEARCRLVGFETKVNADDNFLKLVDPKISSKGKLNTNPGPETIAALKPDLVISKGTREGPLAKSLEILGIPLLYLGAETPEMFLADIENLGKVFGNPGRAAMIMDFYKDKLSMIRLRLSLPEKLSSVVEDETSKPGVLVLEYSNRGKMITMNVPAASWMQTRQVFLSGGHPVWLDGPAVSDGWQVTGFEQIAAWNPDRIFLIVWYRLNGPDVLNALYQDPKWKRLKAVSQKQLYLFPQDIYGWDTATPRWILGTLWMAMATHPEKFHYEKQNMKNVIKEFFNVLYGLDEGTVCRYLVPGAL